jgi:hypothetical protein
MKSRTAAEGQSRRRRRVGSGISHLQLQGQAQAHGQKTLRVVAKLALLKGYF